MKAGWQTRTLGNACQIARGGSPRPIQQFLTDAPDGVNWVKISDATASGKFIYETKEKINPSGVSRSRLVKPGDFLLSNSMSFGRPYIMQTSGCIHDGWLVLSGYEHTFDQGFLYHLLGSPVIFEQFDRLAAGSTVRNLNIELASRVSLPVPPISEQRRIVAVLDEAFDDISTTKVNTEKNLHNARALFESHLQSVFTERGEGWVEKLLEEVVDAQCTLSYGIVQPGHEYANGMPIVRPTDLTTKTISLEGLKRIDPKMADGYRRTTLRGGELLLCVRGSTGVVAVTSPELAGANVTRGIVPVMFEPSLLRQDFGYFLMTSEAVQSQIRAKTYGAALMQINIGDLRKIAVSFPPLIEQEKMTAKLEELSDKTQRLESLYQQKLTALDDLKKSLLHQAFTGAL